jgi:hypothetical protein
VLNGVKNVCEEYGVDFYDMSMDAVTWGFDFQSDMLNFFHNNTTGAAKVTSRIGEILTEKYDFSESDTHQYSNVWEAEDERMIIFRTPDET